MIGKQHHRQGKKREEEGKRGFFFGAQGVERGRGTDRGEGDVLDVGIGEQGLV